MRHCQHISKYLKFILLNSAVIAGGITSGYAATAIAPAPMPTPALAPVSAAQPSNDFKILQDQFTELSKKLEHLEKTQKHASKEAAEVAVAAAKEEVAITQARSPMQSRAPREGYKWSSGNTDINLGAMIKLDAMYDAGAPLGDAINMTALPIKGVDITASKSGNYRMHAKQSQLNVGTLTSTAKGDVKTYLEIDFFGDNSFVSTNDRNSSVQVSSYAPRLRHAYGEFNGWLAGQTWSNFNDMESLPTTLDASGVTGESILRQAQLRYTKQVSQTWRVAVALENPVTDYTDAYDLKRYDSSTISQYGSGTQAVPDLTFNARYKVENRGHLSFRVLVRRLVVKGVAGDTANNPAGVAYAGKATAYGFGISGRVYTVGKDSFFVQTNAGDGIGRYIYDGYGMSAAYNATTKKFQKQRMYGALAGYEHYWADNLRSNLAVGQTRVKLDSMIPIAVPTTAGTTRVTSKMQQAFVNLLYKPVPPVEVGIEYGHFKRSTVDEKNGTGDRVQMSVIYKW